MQLTVMQGEVEREMTSKPAPRRATVVSAADAQAREYLGIPCDLLAIGEVIDVLTPPRRELR